METSVQTLTGLASIQQAGSRFLGDEFKTGPEERNWDGAKVFYLQLFRLPRVQSERPHLGQVDPQAPGNRMMSCDEQVSLAGGGATGVLGYLWIPEHSMHMVTPRLMEAQRGSSSPQSQHTWFPGPLRATPSA